MAFVLKFFLKPIGVKLNVVFFAILFFSLVNLSSTVFAAPSLDDAVKIKKSGNSEKAIKKLNEIDDNKLSRLDLAQKHFALGAWNLDLNKNSEARASLLKSIELSVPQKAHAHSLIATSYKKDKDFVSAALHYNKSFEENPPLNIFFQSRLDYAEMAIDLKQYKKALDNLMYVERRQRGDYRYPEIVWRLIGVELKLNRRLQACRWVRKMFTQFPAHELVRDWGVDLHLNKYQDQSTGCVTTAKDLRQRNKRLLLSGEEEKAKKEIDELIARKNQNDLYEIDVMRAEFLQQQGFSEDALKLLVKYFDSHRNNANYLNLVARTAARANEYPTAVGAYMRVHLIAPGTRAGRQALFSAAFLSYQFQDYDGATRRFQELVKKYGRSGLARDAQWHLAWIKYLKGDFVGAEKGMLPLATKYTGRGRRRKAVRDDRIRYWLAMTELKREKWGEARDLFSQLAKSSAESYYALLAQQRLSEMPTVPLRRDVTSAPTPAPFAVEGLTNLPGVTPESPNEEEESEETMAAEGAEEAADDAAAESNAEDVAASESEPSGVDTKSMPIFKQAKMNERFERANSLIRLGFNDWARWELYEIERRTSNKAHLRPLMEAYNKIGSYNRSSYIADIYFGSDKPTLKLSYPKAFSESVEKYSKRFGVEEELVLSIMRAESHYNKDVSSPVGARGLMQIMPYTGEKVALLLGESVYRDEMLFDPDTNIRWGTSYLSRLQKKFQGQLPLVAAGYNAGPHRVYGWLSSFGNRDMDEFIEHVPFVETRNYMKKVSKNYAVYKSLYSDSKNTLAFLTRPVPVKIEGRPITRENWDPLD